MLKRGVLPLNIKIHETALTSEITEILIAMSEDWEQERSTYGYRKNNESDIEGNRVFLADCDVQTVGYLFGKTELSKNSGSIMPDGTEFFEVEELYVIPQMRSQGIGRALFEFAQNKLKEEGVPYIMLSTATKDYKRILHFYIDEMGMDFWSARLFKKI